MNSNFLDSLVEKILQTQIDVGQVPGSSLSETLDRLLCSDFQLDGPTAGEPPPDALQQTMLEQGQAVPDFLEIMSLPSQNHLALPPPSPPGELEPDTIHEDAAPPSPPSTPAQVAQAGASTDAPPQCPVCGQNFGRPQDRDRHVRTYLPHSFFCPFEQCSWRGDRACNLRAHWLSLHKDIGKPPQPENCKIYNPEPLAQSVVSGASSIELAREIALQAVKIRAPVLGKVDVWEGEWGRRQKIPQ